MKRIVSLLTVIALGLMSLSAFTVTTGSIAEEVACFPINANYTYNYSQQIYTQSQINHQGQIQKIMFYLADPVSLAGSNDWTIYMGHTTRSSFSYADDWEPVANLTQVFSGSISDFLPLPGQWVEITLATPFIYNNTSNLIVAIHEDTPSHGSITRWGGFTCDNNETRGLSAFSNHACPEVNNPPDVYLLADRIAALRLVFADTEAPAAPLLVFPANNASIMNWQKLQWTQPAGTADASGYDVYIDGTLMSENQPETQYTVSDLAAGAHTWYIIARNNVGISPPSATGNFTISGELTIGFGHTMQRHPFGTNHDYECSAALYTADQIGPAGTIDAIGWDCGSTSNKVIAYKIWAKNTTDATMSYQTWQDLTNGATLLKEGIHVPNTQGWQTFNLDAQFNYHGANLIIAVESNSSGPHGGDTHGFRYTDFGAPRHQHWAQDFAQPSENGWINHRVPNIIMHMNSLVENDLGALSITGNQTPTVGQETCYTVTIKNYGTNSQSNYQVKLMGAGNTQLAVVNGPQIDATMTAEIEFLWTPSTAGSTSIYAKVELIGDELASNDQTHPLDINVQGASIQTVTIGDGSTVNAIPMTFHSRSSLYQTLYTEAELGFSIGTITSLVLYNQFTTAVGNSATKIYMGSTTQDDLESGFIPASRMTLVYDGNVNYPAGENAIPINLQTPFLHLGGNLVIMFQRPLDTTSYPTGNFFKCQLTDFDRARHLFSDTVVYDPYYPDRGVIVGQFPQITFMYNAPSIANDISVTNLRGKLRPSVGTAANYTLTLKNNGTATQTSYTVRLMKPNNMELTSVAGPVLNSLQSLDLVIPWIPTVAGEITVHGKIELTGDEIPENNQTVPITIDVQPRGSNAVTIGDGALFDRIPSDFDHRTTLYQTLYLADELGFDCATITSMSIYSQFPTAILNSPTRIYLGSTSQNNLTNGLITPGQMTLVYDGTIDYPAGENAINIAFQIPYLYTGDNLVMTFHRLWDATEYAPVGYFKCQSDPSFRARYSGTNSNPGDIFDYPSSWARQFPQTTFSYIPGQLECDLRALAVTGNVTPTVDMTSTYTVRLRNSGTETQSNYTVKLMHADGIELASMPGLPVESQQTVEVSIPWSPAVDGNIDIYGKVELTGDQFPADNQTPYLNLTINPPGFVTVSVGEGTEYARMPVEFDFRSSLFQTFFYPNELEELSGQITGIRFYNDFACDMDDTPISIWLGTTTQAELTSTDGFIPSTELTLVYSGQVDFPAGENIIEINLDTRFSYPGTDNLVMLIHKDSLFNHSSNNFRCQSREAVRTIKAVSQTQIDPASPPAGSLFWQFPMTTFVVTLSGMGRISGTVKDNHGNPVAGAIITNGTYDTNSNAEGAYSFAVPAGYHYQVAAYAPGFDTTSYHQVLVNADETTILNFILYQLSNDDPQTPVLATALNGNYPNPFNPETTISYSIKEPGQVKLQVYNIKGQLVRSLVDAIHATGHYTQIFNARDDRGRSLSSGVYLLRMQAPGYHKTFKMILMQ